MKILIECDKKYANEVAATLFSELDISRFAINRKGYDLIVDMRDRYQGKGKTLGENETVELHKGKFAIVDHPTPEPPVFGGIDLWDPPEFT